MADYNRYDARVDGLVIEVRTVWDDTADSEILSLSAADRSALAAWLHRHPQEAAKVSYDRAHTGFTRTIAVTAADLDRWRTSHEAVS